MFSIPIHTRSVTMDTNKSENDNKSGKDDKGCDVKSYWYPEDPDFNEVKGGYNNWRHSVVLVPLIFIPIFFSFLWMSIASHNDEVGYNFCPLITSHNNVTVDKFLSSLTLLVGHKIISSCSARISRRD